MKDFCARFLADESGQDLAEYAMLGAFVGLVGILVWSNIVTLMGDRYEEYNTNVNELWATPEPE
jgi:Flp pilus assembly pilin Flp